MIQYRFTLSYPPSSSQRAYPIYKDDLSKTFEKESGQEFFRAKLSGNLTFAGQDYAFINSAAFDVKFTLLVEVSSNGSSWSTFWTGEFWKTDCDFDSDSQSVAVKPSPVDEYTEILAGLDKEFNLIDLAPEIVQISADKRPMVQVYVAGQTSIGCFLSNTWWEEECEAVEETDRDEDYNQLLTYKYHFVKNKTYREVYVTGQLSPAVPFDYAGDPPPEPTIEYGFINGEYGVRYTCYTEGGGQGILVYHKTWAITHGNTILWKNERAEISPDTYPLELTLTPVEGSGATGNATMYIRDLNVYCRLVCDVDRVGGSSTFDIPDDDLCDNNRNYHKILPWNFPDMIQFSTRKSDTPTVWGLYQPDVYYMPPPSYLGALFHPVSRNAWRYTSVWFSTTGTYLAQLTEEEARKGLVLRDCYPLFSVISVLLGQIAPNVTFDETQAYSQFLYAATNPISGISQKLYITPKSNIITSNYDQPAQKAPITLKSVFDMLRDCFRCYWFIDSSNRLRIEHISYFRNGGSYHTQSIVGIDLTTLLNRSGKPWDYASRKFKYDKPEMAGRYEFGWMDDSTMLFDGYPIDILSGFVNKESIENIDVSNFTSDIDYILLNPGSISKDGFVLLSAIDGQIQRTEAAIAGSDFYYVKSVDYRAGTKITIRFDSDYGILTNNQAILMLNGEEYTTITRATNYTIELPVNIYEIAIYRAGSLVANSGDITITINSDVALRLPYLTVNIDSEEYILQNGYVAFHYLQRYYAYDMPALNYQINGENKQALGVKRLREQSVSFPLLGEPELLKKIRTSLGDGTIQKLSLNLSSRNATATIRHDTE